MQAYLTLGSEKHLRAASNAFVMLAGAELPDRRLGAGREARAPGSGDAL